MTFSQYNIAYIQNCPRRQSTVPCPSRVGASDQVSVPMPPVAQARHWPSVPDSVSVIDIISACSLHFAGISLQFLIHRSFSLVFEIYIKFKSKMAI